VEGRDTGASAKGAVRAVLAPVSYLFCGATGAWSETGERQRGRLAIRFRHMFQMLTADGGYGWIAFCEGIQSRELYWSGNRIEVLIPVGLRFCEKCKKLARSTSVLKGEGVI
jgi:hypothetical protein